MLRQWKRHVLTNRHAVKKCRILEHKSKSQSHAAHLAIVQLMNVPIIKEHLTTRRADQANHALHQNRLATSTFAQQHQSLTGWNGNVDIAQNFLASKADVQAFDANKRFIRFHVLFNHSKLAPSGLSV